MEFNTSQHAQDVLQELHRQQQEGHELCDVILMADDQHVPVHRCVLASCSQYFRTMFHSNFADKLSEVFLVPNATYKTLLAVVEYIYTGNIHIDFDDAENILSVADYLCIDRLGEYCAKVLKEHMNVASCMHIKYLADHYNLPDLSSEVRQYIIPRVGAQLLSMQFSELPFWFVKSVLQDHELCYAKETEILDFITKWVGYNIKERSKYIPDLFSFIHVSYFSNRFITEHLLKEPLIVENVDKIILDTISAEAQRQPTRRLRDVIMCRSRSVHIGDEVQLMCYDVLADTWQGVRVPQPHMLDGLEAMIHHNGNLYFLISTTEDIYGYMHHSQERKYFWCLDLERNVWQELKAPSKVRSSSRLLSHINGIYVIDRAGMIESYDFRLGEWSTSQCKGRFDFPADTWYVLPMPIDRYIYVLRVASAGYSFNYGQQSFSLHLYDTVSRMWDTLSECDAGDLDLEDKDRLHSYTASPGCLELKDVLGQTRVKFDIVQRTWTPVAAKTHIPAFLTDVWGSAKWQARTFLVGRSEQEHSVFVMYDHGHSRFKLVTPPPVCLSGLLTSARVASDSLELLI